MYKKFTKRFIILILALLLSVLSFNLIIDPYSMTSYNLLKIPNKFARDDRKEKVAKLYTDLHYDNMLFGSSHVYSMNPLVLTKYLGGNSYNAGVGTARIEDHLGFLYYLERINKLPKSIFIGLDFYSFNINLETNRYFLANEDLNFLNHSIPTGTYFSKFFSIDATRASFKTIKNFLSNSKDRPRFGQYGGVYGCSKEFRYYPHDVKDLNFSKKKLEEGISSISTHSYKTVSPQRLQYVQNIVTLAQKKLN